METSKQNYGKFRKILTVGDHINLRISLSPQKPLLCCRVRGWGERKRERSGHDGKGKNRRDAQGKGNAFYFSIIAIFIGKSNGSLCGGDSSHFGRQSTWGSQLASFELSKFIVGSKADEEKKSNYSPLNIIVILIIRKILKFNNCILNNLKLACQLC